MGITKKIFGVTEEGYTVHIFHLKNSNGMEAKIINYGARLISLMTPDRENNYSDVVLGYDDIESYIKDRYTYFGAIVGRCANRIFMGEFALNNKKYNLTQNEGINHLHGGTKGFADVIWSGEITKKDGTECLQLTYNSTDGEEGYPGNLQTKVIYSLTEDNELKIDYYAVADTDTIVNLTNHSYFNLVGHSCGSILKHQLMINADSFTPVDKGLIPTGEICSVYNTPMDFTTQRPIDWAITSDYGQLKIGNGYDQNFVLRVSGKVPEKAAELYEPGSGRVMEVLTTMPGLQFYSGNFLNQSLRGKDDTCYENRCGLCLETQYFPDAINHYNFKSPVLKAGREYRQTTIYRFFVK